MSMNVYIEFEREVLVISTQKVEMQRVIYSLWQTPTDVSYSIIESANPFEVYSDYVLSVSGEQKFPIYADDDLFCQREPIGTETIHEGKYHLEELKEDIEGYKKSGYVAVWKVR